MIRQADDLRERGAVEAGERVHRELGISRQRIRIRADKQVCFRSQSLNISAIETHSIEISERKGIDSP